MDPRHGYHSTHRSHAAVFEHLADLQTCKAGELLDCYVKQHKIRYMVIVSQITPCHVLQLCKRMCLALAHDSGHAAECVTTKAVLRGHSRT